MLMIEINFKNADYVLCWTLSAFLSVKKLFAYWVDTTPISDRNTSQYGIDSPLR
jgi:hypothetical protein